MEHETDVHPFSRRTVGLRNGSEKRDIYFFTRNHEELGLRTCGGQGYARLP